MEFIWDLDEASKENDRLLETLSPMIDQEDILCKNYASLHKKGTKPISILNNLLFLKKKTKVLVFDNQLSIIKQKDGI